MSSGVKCRFCLGVFFALWFFSGCFQKPGPPIINKLTGKEVVSVRDSVWVFCDAETPAVGPLIFRWKCTKGTLTFPPIVANRERGTDSVKWFAPESSGSAVISVTVVDSRPDSVTDSLIITVSPLVRNFINWDGAVKAGGHFSWGDSCWAGYRLSGWSWSESLPTYLIFMSAVNFQKWQRGEPYEYLIRRPAYNVNPFYDTIPQTGIYYLVIDNSGSMKDCSFWVNIQLTSP